MGQYYNPCFINETKDQVLGWFECYDTNNGAKLMEHSYVGNDLCKNVAYHMVKSPKRLVWCGDYADEVFDGQNYYDQCDDRTKIHSVDGDSLDGALNANTIYINHDKKEWFDLTKQVTPVCSDWDGKVHPLPLLTADGNGRGGGDYDGALMDMVGRWKGDLIEVSDEVPADYSEIEPWFTEQKED